MRARKWQARAAVAAPSTIAQIHADVRSIFLALSFLEPTSLSFYTGCEGSSAC